MINIVFIVPYPNMAESVKHVFNTHPKKDMLYQNISVISAENVNVDKLDGNIVIARGLTYQKIKKYKPLMPKIELSIAALDIINTLKDCLKTFKCKKIAIIGQYNSLSDAKSLFDLFDCEIDIYDESSVEDIPETFSLALQNGCDAFVGGYSLYKYAKTKNANCLVIETGKEAIVNTLNEAIRTYEILENSKISKSIIEHSKDSILHVSKDFKITLMNTEAQNYMKKLDLENFFYQKHINDIFPFMYDNIRTVFFEKKEIANELHKVGDVQVTATYIPIFIGDEITGVVINFTNIKKIQYDEIQIRKKLNEKGLQAKYSFTNIIHKSKLMYDAIKQAEKIAGVSSNVIIYGETGTGKELFAQSIHNASPRKNGPFVAINCSSLPENLIESELFGYIEGAFTNASKGGKAGLIELAHQGTLFLDEISEIPVSFQSKLLRVLQENEVRRIGDNKNISVDVRIISALNKNIYDLVKDGLFRRDLLYRLDVLRIHIPPLRSRPEDILELFMYYVNICNQRLGSKVTSITSEAAKLLVSYEFEGNVRQLKNIVEGICVFSTSNSVDYAQMYTALYHKNINDSRDISINNNYLKLNGEDWEKQVIEETLMQTQFNRKKTAELLGIDRTTLWRKFKKYNIKIT
jgi:transcriptional regulator with PAS, ATPase and Fis domain